MRLIAIFAIATFVIVTLVNGNAATPTPAPPFKSWAAYLSGTWNCTSGATPYTVTYEPALGGLWIRGTNTSGASRSEDMMTYDPHSKQWTVFDMEPSGAWSAMHGASDGLKIAVYDSRTRVTVSIRRVSQNQYHLAFIPRSGKAGAPDVCRRRPKGGDGHVKNSPGKAFQD